MVKIRKRHIYSLVQWLVLAMAAFFVFLFVQNWILYSGVIQCHSESVFAYIFMHVVSIDWLLTILLWTCVFQLQKDGPSGFDVQDALERVKHGNNLNSGQAEQQLRGQAPRANMQQPTQPSQQDAVQLAEQAHPPATEIPSDKVLGEQRHQQYREPEEPRGNTNSNSNSKKGASSLGLDTALLIIASNRPNYLQRTLEAVVKHHPK
jgi:hypothetical protein